MADVKGLHERAVRELERQYRMVLDRSADGVYIYLDDEHKACNDKLADLFGYSKGEWEKLSPFLDNFVAPESQEEVSDGYWRNIKTARIPRSGQFLFVRKDGSQFQAHVTEFPLSYKRRLFSIGFVHQVDGRRARRKG
ncbi:MAG: PAS domain S-box protein [Chloroflexi bacterium]|nr:PAS domain S-box protein [Chloroflexota bacterium]